MGMNEVSDNQLDRGGDMSTPDARLNAAERAALADLEAAAAAADPALAARLRGGLAWKAVPLVRSLRRRLVLWWAAVLQAGWWGVPLTVAGLLLMALGLSAGLALSVVGAVIAAVGVRVLVEMARLRMARTAARRDPGHGPSAA